jgi:hypothetical protein
MDGAPSRRGPRRVGLYLNEGSQLPMGMGFGASSDVVGTASSSSSDGDQVVGPFFDWYFARRPGLHLAGGLGFAMMTG